MKQDRTNHLLTICVGLSWLVLAFTAWFSPAGDISLTERRALAQPPDLTVESLLSGQFSQAFETCAKDQFPGRFTFRQIKAFTRYVIFGQRDTNDIYIKDGYAAKLEYPLNEASINQAAARFRSIYDIYLQGKDIDSYMAVIPDKSYYLAAGETIPALDYERLFSLVRSGTGFASFIDLTGELSIDDYYRTDIHWQQQDLINVANALSRAMGGSGVQTQDFSLVDSGLDYYGVYFGQSALPLRPDRIVCLTNDAIRNSRVYNLETDQITAVYDQQKLDGRDPYDVYLSGASPLLVIENPEADTEQALIVFRDSFGSSLVPLLLEDYSTITLIDIRYMASSLIGDYVEFSDQDVLFLYSTLILNEANMLK